ncbi:MAG: hypothetical protein EOO52_13740 [Gammaproteobacteria bacterium]|nr:MAG: hypothetical protein EOO52_13740 [Gammaproteobacteria bacterium]
MSSKNTLPLPQLTEVMVTAEIFQCVKECHALASNNGHHMNLIRVDGTLKIASCSQLNDLEKTTLLQLVYSTDRGFIFTPLSGDLAYG